jgi:hypothetical protein
LVALNAWLQYRSADELMSEVNRRRGLAQTPPKTFFRRLWDLVGGTYIGRALSALLKIPDLLRMLFRYRKEMLATQREQQQVHNIQLEKNTLPWTVEVAFYALSGAAVLKDDHDYDLTIDSSIIEHLAEHKAAALIPLQRAALQHPGKASILAKMITCTQALWFCSQCIARLSQNMAISLIELNTFAHCISAFFIYAFWWHKPYDVEAHVYIDDLGLLQDYLISKVKSGKYRRSLATTSSTPSSGNGCTTFDGFRIGYSGTYDVFERTPDGKVSVVAQSMRFHTGESSNGKSISDTEFIKIKIGETIPGTGFIVRCRDERVEVSIWEHTLPYWERLWLLRRNNMLGPQLNLERRFGLFGMGIRAKNLDREFQEAAFGDAGMSIPLILTSVFLVYGGVHLLAWQYNFQTNAEGTMWRIASIITASSGLIILLAQTKEYLNRFYSKTLLERLRSCFLAGVGIFCCFVIVANLLARSFLVIESFRALPNSPSSVYEIPRWTAYLPHL